MPLKMINQAMGNIIIRDNHKGRWEIKTSVWV